MDFNQTNYQVLKIKKYFKNCGFIFFFHSAKLTSSEWLTIEQDFKKLKLKYYKVFNGTTSKFMQNSVYKHFIPIICCTVLFIDPQFKLTKLELNKINKDLKSLFALYVVKLNNKIYSVEQLRNFKTFSYEQNMFYFHKLLDKGLKSSYILTNNKIVSK